MNDKLNILVVGCGAMGSALIKGWQSHYQIVVIDPSKADTYKNVENLPLNYKPDVVVIAVKPQLLGEVLPLYSKFSEALFISIAAGVRIGFYEKTMGKHIKIIRVMPNLAVQVGEGASAYVINKNCDAPETQIVEELFSKVGIVTQLSDENLFDAVTALSGSGPAYVFFLCECLAKAGISLGLNHDMANKLARQTIIGSGAMLKNNELTSEKLRASVTSKAGTTEAALKILMNANGLENIMQKTFKAAFERAQEIANT
jgi:pyrroline-5-carboxylate reductase